MAELFNDLLKLNLQFFAEDSGAEGATSETENEEENEEEKEGNSEGETIQLTPEELAKRIESESDKKLNKVLERKMKEWEAEKEQARKEGERLAKLSAKERQEEEVRKKAEALEKREQELLRKELKAQTIQDLHEKQVPTEFAEIILGEPVHEPEEVLKKINTVKKVIDETVDRMVTERLKGKSPTTGTGATGKPSDATSQQKFMDIFEKNRIVGK